MTVWDAWRGKESLKLTGHTGPVWNVAFSPNGERLASASWDGTVKIWDVTTGQETLTFKGHGNWVWGVAFSLDGQRLHHASRTEENLRRLKEASSKVLRRPDADEPDYSSALQYAQAASRLRPGEGPILTLLGVAQYRVGDYQAALETLTRSENINSTGPDGTRPADLAFLAMTQYQLGNRALARATLDRLRETVKNPRWANNANPQAFVQEAEILIRGEDN